MKKQKSINIKDAPTCVGKRLWHRPKTPPMKVYSHSRGKKNFSNSSCVNLMGILPLAWEKVLFCQSTTV